ncbi:MAG: NHL repeat-containing protein [Phycisphaerales bacterium]|nr:NHL repeat-containing protein [Phycisphaerales bacterium]
MRRGQDRYPHFGFLILSFLVLTRVVHAGDLLVASFLNSKIARFAESNGLYLGDFVPAGSGGLTTPHALGFGPDGHLYVATFGGGSVLRYDATTGAPLPSSTGAPGTAEFVASGAGGLVQAAGMDFGPDGNIYVSDHATSRVLRYNGTTGTFIDVFVPTGSGGLDDVELIKFGSDGHLYACSAADGSILRYKGTTGVPLPGPLGALGTAQFVTPGSGGLSDPHDLAFGPDGDLYVASFGSSRVIQYDGTTGALLSLFVSAGVPSAHGIEFGNDGDLYVAAFGSTGIPHFDGTNGSSLGNFVSPGIGSLSGPTDLLFFPLLLGDIDGDGDVDLNDVGPFVDALLGSPQAPIHLSRSDLDDNGAADGNDIAEFIAILLD